MSRRPRPDIQPEIVLPDGREQETRANEVIDDDWRARVYPRGERPINDAWTVKFAELQRRLSRLRFISAGINEGLLHFMMEHCELAATSPKLDRNGQMEFRDGGRVAILRRVGCRVRMAHQEIADRYDFKARTTVTEHIKRFKEHSLIVNCGRGWNEFDAHLCWRGDLWVCRAYRRVQRVRDGLVITDGTTTLVTEDMDGDDDGEDDRGNSRDHSPPGVEEEGS